MSLVGFKAQNHGQQTAKRGARPKVDDRGTEPAFFNVLNRRFRFTVDVAALPHNAKLPRYFTPEQDGLAQSWAGERVWCNPPYSNLDAWVSKAAHEFVVEPEAELIVMLLPANRTEQAWWQSHIEPSRDGRRPNGPRVEFLPGRMRFVAPGAQTLGANERPPFGCCLVIWASSEASS